MADLVMDTLAVRVTGAGDHAHRVESIVLRALELVGAGIGELDDVRRPPGSEAPPTPTIDLENQTDDEAAATIAGAWIDALTIRLEG